MTGANDITDTEGIRLQRVLAGAGWGSRRACEVLIDEGRVEVDGHVVVGQGMRVFPDLQRITVDGMRVVTNRERVYLALNKPRGVLTTMSDPEGRPNIGDLLGGKATGSKRLFHVGRLDADTEGLLLLTNDGELAHRLAHPSYGVTKTYLAEVPGPIPRDLGKQLKAGVELEDGMVTVDRFRVVASHAGRAQVELTLHEGRKHIVRRLLAQVGHPVERLVRTRVGPVNVGSLRAGKLRPLTKEEVGGLLAEVGL